MERLLYITNQICGPGGLERVLSIKASYLAEKYNYDIHILTLNQADQDLFYEFSPKINHHNISVYGNPIQYFLKYKKGIKKVINKVNPNLVIVCDDGLKGLLFPLLIGKNSPLIYERHVSKNIEIKSESSSVITKVINSLKFKLMNWGGSKFDKFVVLTNGNLKEWPLNNLLVIPNPLSFYPNSSSHLNNKKVIAVGKQSFQKGYDRLLKIWKQVVEKNPEWVLEIYGSFDKDQKLEALADELQINEQVFFYPPIKDIGSKYQEASIYCMSSRYEGFGMVLTEAMAYGVPCISFDCPYGPSDIIQNTKNGYIVENDDIDGFAEKLNILIENQQLRKELGVYAKESVKSYLPENIVSMWDTLFKELIN